MSMISEFIKHYTAALLFTDLSPAARRIVLEMDMGEGRSLASAERLRKTRAEG